jgi:hypothetical protein
MRQSASDIVVHAGGTILKIDMEGWNYGIDQTPIEEDSQWAINSMSIKHGWIKFPAGNAGNRQPTVERVVSIFEPKGPPPTDDAGWGDYVEVELVQVTDGEDFAKQVLYTVSSVGGHAAVKPIIDMIASRLSEENPAIFPVVELEFDSYFNKKWKRDVATPIINVVEWVDGEELAATFEDAGGEEAKAEAAAPKKRAPKKEAEKKAPRSRAKKADEEAASEPEAAADEVPTEADDEPKPVRRRRG